MTPAAPEFFTLANRTDDELRDLGMTVWARYDPEEAIHRFCASEDGNDLTDLTPGPSGRPPTLWVFPKTWFNSIPIGLPVVNIFWQKRVFDPNTTDNDSRFGFLAFGIVVRR